jgi:glycosyltransferase involved in cell wall biosynthesis
LGAITAALKVVYNPSSRRALSRKLAEFQPDVVHIHNFFPLLSPSIFDACRDAGIPSVLTLHNFRILCPTALLHPADAGRHRSLRQACWWTIPQKVYRNSAAATMAVATMVEYHKRIGTWTRKVDRFIALTDFAKRTFTEGGLPAERIVVKPNSVAAPPAFHGCPRDGALFVGRLDEQKGIRLLLQVWKDLDYPLRIIGDGPLSELARQAPNNRIVYLGQQSREVVQREMQAARFMVVPSRGYEMLPGTVLEAFSSQLPVICSDLPSLGEVVEHGVTGLKFPTGDPNGLTALVRWAIANPSAANELGCRAQAVYQARYTPAVNFRQLIGIYQSVCREPRLRANQAAPHRPGPPTSVAVP